MKQLGPTQRILLLLAAIFLVVSGIFVRDYFQKEDRISKLNREISRIQTELQGAGQTPDLDALKKERDRLDTELASAPTTFPKTTQSVDVANLIYQSSRRVGADLLKLQAVSTNSQKVGSTNYVATTFTAQFRAQLWQIRPLLQEIEQGGFNTLTTGNLKVTPAPGSWDIVEDINLLSQSG